MAINDSAVVPLYQQVKDDIRAAIESGKYKTNEKIPPEPELSAEYSVSRITVRRAVEELCAEGYLVKMQGRGTFVSKPRIHRKFTSGRGAASFTEICKENGMVPGARLLNRQIAAKLDISERTVQVHRLSAYRKLDVHNTAELAPITVLLERGKLGDVNGWEPPAG